MSDMGLEKSLTGRRDKRSVDERLRRRMSAVVTEAVQLPYEAWHMPGGEVVSCQDVSRRCEEANWYGVS